MSTLKYYFGTTGVVIYLCFLGLLLTAISLWFTWQVCCVSR